MTFLALAGSRTMGLLFPTFAVAEVVWVWMAWPSEPGAPRPWAFQEFAIGYSLFLWVAVGSGSGFLTVLHRLAVNRLGRTWIPARAANVASAWMFVALILFMDFALVRVATAARADPDDLVLDVATSSAWIALASAGVAAATTVAMIIALGWRSRDQGEAEEEGAEQ